MLIATVGRLAVAMEKYFTMTNVTNAFIENVMSALSKKRKAFWSEADFQFALSEMLKSKLGKSAKIYLERPVLATNQKDKYAVDIWIKMEDRIYPIELKYATKEAEIVDNDNEHIFTSEQVAYDQIRFLYLYDIKRIEDIKNTFGAKFGKGYAIILTSDANFYKLSRNPKGTLDESFRIHADNENFNQTIQWNNQDKQPDHWTKKQKPYNNIFTLQTKVNFCWKDYSVVKTEDDGKNLNYKYLINEIK